MKLSGDGFFILKTRSPTLKEGEYEYRVAYSPDISTIFGEYDDSRYNWRPHKQGIWNTFKACFLSSSENAAKSYAGRLSSLHGKETECGIMVIHSFHKSIWEELIN